MNLASDSSVPSYAAEISHGKQKPFKIDFKELLHSPQVAEHRQIVFLFIDGLILLKPKIANCESSRSGERRVMFS